LDVSQNTVSKRLKAMGKIQKEGKWVPHELSELTIQNRYTCISLFSRQKKFLYQVMEMKNGPIMYIYDNPKWKKLWIDPEQLSTSHKRNIYGNEVMLSI
jgi:hypothetical protein